MRKPAIAALAVAAGVGVFTAACSVLPGWRYGAQQDAAGGHTVAQAALERACIEAPGDAAAWQRLGEYLQAQGDTERAARMLTQASTLREHTLTDDYATLRAARDEAREELRSVAEWPADMPRTELRALGPAMLELRRVGGQRAGAAPSVARLEISNGNGVRGLAAAWGRTLRSKDLTIIRLSNMRPFAEPSSRIEYRPASAEQAQSLAVRIGLPAIEGNTESRKGSPDMRLVLGRDLRILK